MIATAVSLFTSWLPPDVGRKLFGQPPDVRLAESIRPEGKAYPVDGGYRVQGRWDFASGIHHANWLMCTCQVMHGDAPRLTSAGTPEIRSLLVPAESATIKDTWSVVGKAEIHYTTVYKVFARCSVAHPAGRRQSVCWC